MKSLQFLGATRTVTGSKYAVRAGDSLVLIDCGLFQGLKELRLRNWEPLPIDIGDLNAIILTHAHIDHTGYVPRIVKDGYEGPIYASRSTCGLARILLPDTGRLEEEDAKFANRRGFSKHSPALPLFTESDAKRALKLFQPLRFYEDVAINSHVTARLGASGHILGSAFILLELKEKKKEQPVRVLFSGDIGRYNRPILNDPVPPVEADYLVLESTYGDRLHTNSDVHERLQQVITRTLRRGGTVIIPSFAVGRTQEVLYLITELRDRKALPEVPIFVDSPMAVEATREYLSHTEEHDPEMKERMTRHAVGSDGLVTYVRNYSESLAIARSYRPSIVISSSGMASGGRVLHHLAARLPDPQNTVLFVGYQAAGTRGRSLIEGDKEIKIHGQLIPVRAEIAMIDELSAHADYGEILEWLKGFRKPPKTTFLVHGEEPACEALAQRISEQFGWKTAIPDYAEKVELV